MTRKVLVTLFASALTAALSVPAMAYNYIISTRRYDAQVVAAIEATGATVTGVVEELDLVMASVWRIPIHAVMGV